MRRQVIRLLCVLGMLGVIVLASAAIGQSLLTKHAEKAAAQLAELVAQEKPDKQVKVAFGAFCIKRDGIRLPSPFLDVFQSRLAQAMQQTGKFIFLQADEAKLKELAKEWELAESGLTAENRQRIGKLLEADYMLFGCASESEHRVLVTLELTNVDNRKTEIALVDIVKDEIPSGLELYPKTTESVQGELKESEKPLTPTKTTPQVPMPIITQSLGDLKLSVSLNRLNAVYRKDEEVRLYLWANKPCYLWIFYVDAAGKNQMIFPNRFRQNNFLPFDGRETILFPTDEDPFKFVVTEPYGTELIFVYASTTPLDLTGLVRGGEVLRETRGIVAGMRSRGIKVVVVGKSEFAEARCAIVTVEK